VKALFEQLEAIDCSSIKRIEPDELEIGGGTESYSIVYGGDRTFDIRYGGGVTYRDGMLIVEPIQAFIRGLKFPFGATTQYKASLPQPTAVPAPPPPAAVLTATLEATSPPTPASTAAPTTTLTVINNSDVDIEHVYLAPSYSDQWGDDLLGGRVIADGESITLTDIPFGTYDLKAESTDDVVIDAWHEQTFDGPRTWRLWPATGGSSRGSISGPSLPPPVLSAPVLAGRLNKRAVSPIRRSVVIIRPPGLPQPRIVWTGCTFDSSLPAVPRRINIHETHSSGFIVRVEVIAETDQAHTVWEGEPAPADECPRAFSFLVSEIDVPVERGRIHVDQREGGDWTQIDAVELVGLEVEG
ncbi:MAG: hypothetical protein PVI07_05640, partial [Anaerolineae bacterium]|jgi:hypothetical protein